MTSSRRALLLGRPTLRGMTVPGKTTMLRMGRMGRTLGRTVRWPLLPVRMTVPSGVRSMIWDSDIGFVLGPWSFVLCGLDQLGEFDPEQAVAVGGGDFPAVRVGGDFDFAGECAVVDFHQVDADLLVGGGFGRVEAG